MYTKLCRKRFQYFKKSLIFLAHLSWRLKWAFIISSRPSSVYLYVCLSVRTSVNLSYFRLLLKNPWANFIQTLHKSFLDNGNSSLFKWRVTPYSKRRQLRNSEKIHWSIDKNFFFRTTALISTKLSTNHPWVKGIQDCSMKGPPFSKGRYIYEIAKIHWQN